MIQYFRHKLGYRGIDEILSYLEYCLDSFGGTFGYRLNPNDIFRHFKISLDMLLRLILFISSRLGSK